MRYYDRDYKNSIDFLAEFRNGDALDPNRTPKKSKTLKTEDFKREIINNFDTLSFIFAPKASGRWKIIFEIHYTDGINKRAFLEGDVIVL